MKKQHLLSIILAAALTLSGCNMLTVNAERDGAQVVATVNGENITKKQVYDLAGYTSDDRVETYERDERQAKKEQILDSLIGQRVVLQKAKEKGFFDFSEDEKKEIEDTYASYTQPLYDASLEDYKEQAKTDSSINPEELAQRDVNEYLESLGYTPEKLRNEVEEGVAYNKLIDSITGAVEVTDSDVQAGYDEQFAAQKESYDASPSQLITDDSNGKTILYYPSGDFVRVRHILIKLSDEALQEISGLRTDEKDAEADALRESALGEIAAKANEALAKAQESGADLEALIDEFGEDPGMDSREDGYPVHKDYTGYVGGFTEAALALTEIGKPSELIATDFGYHILWLTEKPAQGAVAYDSVKGLIKETVTTEKQDEALSAQVSEWIATAESEKQITRYVKRLQD